MYGILFWQLTAFALALVQISLLTSPPPSNSLLRPYPGNCCLSRYSWNQTSEQTE